LEKSAAIDSVVFVIVRNVIWHNLAPKLVGKIWFHLFLPIGRDFIPGNHPIRASGGTFPQFLLCRCSFSTLIFAKTPRSGVSPQRGV
jgi:hypothetical protein